MWDGLVHFLLFRHSIVSIETERSSPTLTEWRTVSCGTVWATSCPLEGGIVSTETERRSPRLTEGLTVSCGTNPKGNVINEQQGYI